MKRRVRRRSARRGAVPKWSTAQSTKALAIAWVIWTPFGSPVEPEVKRMWASCPGRPSRSSGSSLGRPSPRTVVGGPRSPPTTPGRRRSGDPLERALSASSSSSSAAAAAASIAARLAPSRSPGRPGRRGWRDRSARRPPPASSTACMPTIAAGRLGHHERDAVARLDPGLAAAPARAGGSAGRARRSSGARRRGRPRWRSASRAAERAAYSCRSGAHAGWARRARRRRRCARAPRDRAGCRG